ncbi:MAG: sulfatase-like hydrolase/transferase [Neisseriaceae bacterium]|nr:sulfatase-like hydrolase/transferase [Neisseriaceae bacterium]
MSFLQLSNKRTFPPCDGKLLFKFILSFLLPNIIFFGIAYYLNATRLIINIDYIIPCVLLLFRNRLIRISGIVILLVFMLIETHLLLLKFFPFLDIAMAIDLLPFIFIGPKLYLILTCVLIFCMIFIVFSAWFLNKNQPKYYPIVFTVFMLLLYGYAGIFYAWKYKDEPAGEDGVWSTHPFYIHSQVSAYKGIMSDGFAKSLLTDATLHPYEDFDTIGMDYIKKPYNSKILFIVAESFGTLKNQKAQETIFQELYNQSDRFEFIQHGSIGAKSSTLAAEFRELCRKSFENGFDFSKTDDQEFADCVPQQLKAQGYQTVSFHGASSYMYKRRITYPKLGFQKMVFGEDTLDKKQCHSFHGTCDSELFDLVAQEFKNNDKAFVYWLTLTSHHPFSALDITNHRFDCTKNGIKENDLLCRNLKLQVQFLDQLAELSNRPEMKGVEVFLVGDHPVPNMGAEDFWISETIKVSFVHFKIKE